MPETQSDFHDVRFPLHLAFGARGGPLRPTDIVTLTNGAEVRNAKGKHSRRQYNAIAGVKSKQQAVEIIDFFESRFGPLFGFRFRDPLDYEANSDLSLGDGTDRNFDLIKSYGDGPHIYRRRITKPVEGTVRAFIDGAETAVAVDYDRGKIQFETPPAAGAVVSAHFEFDVPVRFASESLDIVLDDFGAMQIQDIPLIEILPMDAANNE